jgi:hypothetical protein
VVCANHYWKPQGTDNPVHVCTCHLGEPSSISLPMYIQYIPWSCPERRWRFANPSLSLQLPPPPPPPKKKKKKKKVGFVSDGRRSSQPTRRPCDPATSSVGGDEFLNDLPDGGPGPGARSIRRSLVGIWCRVTLQKPRVLARPRGASLLVA